MFGYLGKSGSTRKTTDKGAEKEAGTLTGNISIHENKPHPHPLKHASQALATVESCDFSEIDRVHRWLSHYSKEHRAVTGGILHGLSSS